MSLATPTKVEQLQMTLHATAKRTSLYRGLRVPKRDSLSESRMREICTSGLMSGRWKRSMAGLVRHRQTKEPVTDRPCLNHRATSRLYPNYDDPLSFGSYQVVYMRVDFDNYVLVFVKQ